MPRRRRPRGAGCAIAARSGSPPCSKSASSAMPGEPGKDAFSSVNLFADGRFDLGVEGQVDIHPRAEADEAEALALPELGARLDVAKDAARDQPRDLHAGDVLPVGRAQPERVALVAEGRLVERRVQE